MSIQNEQDADVCVCVCEVHNVLSFRESVIKCVLGATICLLYLFSVERMMRCGSVLDSKDKSNGSSQFWLAQDATDCAASTRLGHHSLTVCTLRVPSNPPSLSSSFDVDLVCAPCWKVPSALRAHTPPPPLCCCDCRRLLQVAFTRRLERCSGVRVETIRGK